MIRLRKNLFLVTFAIASCFANSPRLAQASTSNASRQDMSAISGNGVWNDIDVTRVDSDANVRLYNGSIILGDKGTAPTTVTTADSTRGNYNLQVPCNNVGGAWALGDIVISSAASTGACQQGVATSGDKTILGVAVAANAGSGAIGYIAIIGYAVVHTTGTVAIGDLLVSTSATAGYAATNNSAGAGTVVGRALSAGTAAGGLTLALIK